jgi:hypothetical protein
MIFPTSLRCYFTVSAIKLALSFKGTLMYISRVAHSVIASNARNGFEIECPEF